MDLQLLLSKDLKEAGEKMGKAEARYLVDLYYQIQEFRKAAGNQKRALGDVEPGAVITGVFDVMAELESRIAKALGYYTNVEPMGKWAKQVVGIGPVLSAGLIAHIDPTKVNTVGGIWRFAGLDPTVKWNKGQKRPWNAELKTLCWKIGDSFVKVSSNPKSLYGGLYIERKAFEVERNERGDNAEEAKRALAEKKYRDDTTAFESYTAGKLPPARIHLRATRWVVKIFLYHWFAESYKQRFGRDARPPMPYVIAHMGHADFIKAEHAA